MEVFVRVEQTLGLTTPEDDELVELELVELDAVELDDVLELPTEATQTVAVAV